MNNEWAEDANAPTFSLFSVKSTPQQEAELDTFVNPIIYQRWTKAERRNYQRLKTDSIAKKIAEKQLTSIEDITSHLEGLILLKDQSDEPSPFVDDLIKQIKGLQIETSSGTAQSQNQNQNQSENP